jgi:hypothetical protein
VAAKPHDSLAGERFLIESIAQRQALRRIHDARCSPPPFPNPGVSKLKAGSRAAVMAQGQHSHHQHEVVPQTGSYEVKFTDGRPPRYFYWDHQPSRRLDPNTLTGEQARNQAQAAARAERDS